MCMSRKSSTAKQRLLKIQKGPKGVGGGGGRVFKAKLFKGK